jgi:uncharacterized phage protein (TIGR02220 family)
MEWYPKDIDAFERWVSGLSLAERGAYDALLSEYYKKETPLIANAMAMARVCRAQTPEEVGAVTRVIGLFFREEGGVYRNTRADEEIAKYKEIIGKRRSAGRAGAEKRWESPPVASATTVNSLQEVGEVSPTTPLGVIEGEKADATAKAAARLTARNIAHRMIEHLNATGGFRYRYATAHVNLIMARVQRDGATEEECRKVIDMQVKAWGGDPEKRKFLSPDTLFNGLKFNKYRGQIDTAMPAPPRPHLLYIHADSGDGSAKRCIVSTSASGDFPRDRVFKAAQTAMTGYLGGKTAKYIDVEIDGKLEGHFSVEELKKKTG